MKNRPIATRTPARRPGLLHVLLLLAGLAFCLGASGCELLGGGGKATSAGTPGGAASADGDAVALVMDGREISVAEVDRFLQESYLDELLRKPESQVFEAREKGIRELIQRRLVEAEAAKRGVTPEALFDEVVEAAPAPGAADVADWYARNQARLRGAKLEDVSTQIEQLLVNEARAEAWADFMRPKLDALDYEIKIQPPRADLGTTRLIRGNANAPVTLTTFSDYQCPYCIRSEPVLAEVLERYPDKVRVVHRHFPLDSIHPFARPAAEAAMCADEQGKFWAYHDAIFARNGKLEAGSFAKIGSELGLDGDALAACIDEGRFKAFVQSDLEAGRRAGVTGTPAFFVNGIALKGARDADQLAEVIEEELARIEN